jgi:hypothetical protein
MPHNYEWQGRIKAVEREFLVARHGMDKFREIARRDPTVLAGDVRFREIGTVIENMEATYVIRLFAEFESGLRQFWGVSRGTDPGTHDLIEGIASMCRIPHEKRINAHAMREYRNSMVHERDEQVEQVSIENVRKSLIDFFRFLPPHW